MRDVKIIVTFFKCSIFLNLLFCIRKLKKKRKMKLVRSLIRNVITEENKQSLLKIDNDASFPNFEVY